MNGPQKSSLKKFAAFLVLIAAVAACKKDEQTSINFHQGYYPIEEGRFIVYDVQEVTINDDQQQNDTFNYQIKAIIGPAIVDNEGRTVHRYERYQRFNDTLPWVMKDIWTTIVTDNRAELVEENQRTIKLVFAPTEGKEWNTNAYNAMPELNCYYRDIHKPQVVGGHLFDSTLVVEQENFPSFIDYRRKFETYAKGVGMIYKHYKDFYIQNGDTLNVVHGYEMTMRLVDYGVE